jgi:hypothetical protein
MYFRQLSIAASQIQKLCPDCDFGHIRGLDAERPFEAAGCAQLIATQGLGTKMSSGAIERLVEAGSAVGLTVVDLIRMLRSGMTLESLLDLIEIRMATVRPSTRSWAA